MKNVDRIQEWYTYYST